MFQFMFCLLPLATIVLACRGRVVFTRPGTMQPRFGFGIPQFLPGQAAYLGSGSVAHYPSDDSSDSSKGEEAQDSDDSSDSSSVALGGKNLNSFNEFLSDYFDKREREGKWSKGHEEEDIDSHDCPFAELRSQGRKGHVKERHAREKTLVDELKKADSECAWLLKSVAAMDADKEDKVAFLFDEAVDKLHNLPWNPAATRYLFAVSNRLRCAPQSIQSLLSQPQPKHSLFDNRHRLYKLALDNGDLTLLRDHVDFYLERVDFDSFCSVALNHPKVDPFEHLNPQLREAFTRLSKEEKYQLEQLLIPLMSLNPLGHRLKSIQNCNFTKSEAMIKFSLLAHIEIFGKKKALKSFDAYQSIGVERMKWLDELCKEHDINFVSFIKQCGEDFNQLMAHLAFDLPLKTLQLKKMLNEIIITEDEKDVELLQECVKREGKAVLTILQTQSIRFQVSVLMASPELFEDLILPDSMPSIEKLLPADIASLPEIYLKGLIAKYGLPRLLEQVNEKLDNAQVICERLQKME